MKKEFNGGDRVAVSDVSVKAAENGDKNRNLFVGIDSMGSFVVENIDTGEFTAWKYIVPFKLTTKYFAKSVQDTIATLNEREYVFIEGVGFVSPIETFVFGLEDWKFCGKEFIGIEIAETLGFPRWMIDVVETDDGCKGL